MFQNGSYSLENFILVLTLKFVSKKSMLLIDEYKRDIYLEKFSGLSLNLGLSLACLLNKWTWAIHPQLRPTQIIRPKAT